MYHDLYVTYLLSVAPAKQVSLGQHVPLILSQLSANRLIVGVK